MIFANRHIIFRSVAGRSRAVNDHRCKAWFARRAIDHFVSPVFARRATSAEVTMLVHANVPQPFMPDALWHAHYVPQIDKSRAALKMAIDKQLDIYIALLHHDETELEDVIDWLNMLPHENPRLLTKLTKISWPQAVSHAQKWSDKQARRNATVAGSDGTTLVLKCGRFCWYRLDTLNAIHGEGQAMRNCLARGEYDILGGEAKDFITMRLYSLRDAKGRSLITVLTSRNRIGQAYEPANRPVREAYQPYLQALVDVLKTKPG